MKARARV